MAETGQGTAKGKGEGTPAGSHRWLWAVGGLAAVAAVGMTLAPVAMAFRGVTGHGLRLHALMSHGSGGHGARGAFAAQVLSDPAAAKEHVAAMSEFVLRSVSATDEQKQKTKQITDRLIDQLGPVVEKHRQLHAALVAELAKPQVDRAAIEKLRQDGMALADEASRIAIDGVEDVADVLTPDQRKELIDLGRRLHGHDTMD
jgi:Spy/CpxP family protein refolding chaperone